MPILDSDGVPIHYEVFGEGKPIVLVHGFASSLKGNWVAPRWIETLTAIRCVVALDCRGHGESGKPHEAEAYSGDRMPNDVLRVMDHLEIDKADLFGYSMGGGISIRLMTRSPERFTSVVLGGVGNVLARRGAGGRPNVAEALLADDASTVTDPTARAFRQFAEANKNDLKALGACMQSGRAGADGASLAQVKLPVLIVVGEKDDLVGSADELASAIPGARLEKIPDRDHLTVVPDRRFKKLVVDFLTERSSG
jgi:pimeloyl-ACP methyl ester carboxylesterase